MSNKAIETYLVEKIKEFLNTAEIFEREVLASQEKHMTNQIVVQDYKKKNPDGNFTEVKKNLIDIQDSYYKSFLLEQNLRHMLSTLKELYLMAQSTGVKIDLSENHKSVIDEIMKHSNNVFRAERNKDGGPEVSTTPPRYSTQISSGFTYALTPCG